MVHNSFKKDPPTMYSDLPIDKFEYIRKLGDNDLIMMYKKYQERDNLPDSKEEYIHDINDRIAHKDALIAIMRDKGIDFDAI